MGGAVFLPCWLFGLRHPSSLQTSLDWSLQSVGWGQVLVRKWRLPGWLTPMSTPQNCRYQCLCPHNEPQPPPASTETLQYQQIGHAQAPVMSLLFLLGPSVHKNLCAVSKSAVSVSCCPVEFLQSDPVAF